MDRKNYIQGLIYGGLAFTLWGFLPLYWRTVSAISPYQVFAHRVVWSFIFVVILMNMRKEWKPFFFLIKDIRNWPGIVAPAMTISFNWLLFIWAVNNGYVLESSLGYYINPLVLTLIGAVFLNEKLNRLQMIGIAFATVGVAIKSISYGRIPYIALSLAFSFAIYGVLKKRSKLKSLYGLGFETYVVSLPALIYILFSEFQGHGISGNLSWYYWILIAFSGVATAIPLLLYAESTKKLPLTVLGFLQYIAPTLMLILGVFVYREPFDSISLIAFGLIWIGLAFFSYSQYRLLKRKK
ncbi:MAG: EamA family transporter RarD [Tissierellales bacterium]|jgi:chloramphenicol-sensitive protein RarD|nr:EamA family transporter RarD [Tissierellales bacterium]MBN2826587.1 EamA family transporter RarD [Tissierellales bacterium]